MSAESRAVALPRSSSKEQAGGTVDMKGEVEFRGDTKSKLMKAVSGTEWMHRKQALNRGKQVCVCVVCERVCVCVCKYIVCGCIHVCLIVYVRMCTIQMNSNS